MIIRKEGIKKGIKKGIKQGEKETIIKIVKSLYTNNADIKLITNSTGLTEEEVLKIVNK